MPSAGHNVIQKLALPYKQGLMGPAVRCRMWTLICPLWSDDQGQDIAEYAVMLAVILVLVVGTIRLIGSNANNVFSQVGSSLNN
jgi:Flp pilus assembly pilin Flp